MEDRLPGARARVEHEAEIALGVRGGHRVRQRDQLGQEIGIARRELDDVAVLLGLRDHQEVHRSLRSDVADREGVVRLGDDLGGDLAFQDAREDRRLTHASSLPAALCGRRAVTTAAAPH
jgi:hypothetical protein